MSRYMIHFELLPPYAFGIPVPGHEVVPAGDNPTLRYDAKTRVQSITRSDGTPTVRRPEEQFQAGFRLNDIEFSFADNNCVATLDAADEETAVQRARDELTHLCLMFASSKDQYPMQIVPSTRAARMDGVPGALTKRTSSQLFFVYDNQDTSRSLTYTASLLDGTNLDQVLRRALNYLGLGDALTTTLPPGAPDEQGQLLLPLRFLQYWKALATIVGDPARAKDHQSRPKKLGFNRHFFRQHVDPMHEIRNRFDVAHIENANERRSVTYEDVLKCRSVACTVINAYFERTRNE